MAFTVSMDRPGTHFFHVELRASGLKGDVLDFKMPAWTPGYYRIVDFAKNVLNFRAEDASGRALKSEKIAKNTWRVRSANAPAIRVQYDVYAFDRSIAESFLDESRAYISPAGVFMHAAGRLAHPAAVTLQPYKGWSKISTGLDPVQGKENTFFAPDFDILYDSPFLIANQEVMRFDVRGIPHHVAFIDYGQADRAKLAGDLKAMVEGAVDLMGDIPYKHYTFIGLGPGGGGLEHLNSTAFFFNPASLTNPSSYAGFLSFLAHEYFHHFNVKRIRPVALGPFDYDRENYTNMLWVSEGLTVYYQDLILLRAGLLTREQYFDKLRRTIAKFENSPGSRYQSATESSMDTWTKYFARSENIVNTTISYYDKGAALGVLLDLKIRHETGNRRSLDDVMRSLYRKYYQQRKRGFTDEEFREECETAAGTGLGQIFEYASTVQEIDYRKHFAYAGLEIDTTLRDRAGAYLGASAELQGGKLMITRVDWESPARDAGIAAQDEVRNIDGASPSGKSLEDLLASKKPGDALRLELARRNATREVQVTLGKKSERSFRIQPVSSPAPAQAAILKDWLRQP